MLSASLFKTFPSFLGTHNRPIHPKNWKESAERGHGWEVNLVARRLYVGISLTPLRRQRRVNWLRAHAPRRFLMVQWRRVLFTGESRFKRFRPDRWHRVYRHRGDMRDLPMIALMRGTALGVPQSGSWVEFSMLFKTPLVVIAGNLTAVWYRDEILQPHTVHTLCPAKQLDISTRLREAACYKQECVGTSWQPRSVPHRALVGSVGQESEESCKPTLAQLRNALVDEWPTVQWGVWMPWWIPWPGWSEQLHRHGVCVCVCVCVIHSTSETMDPYTD